MGDAPRKPELLKAELFAQLARVGKALANGTRLELLDLLAQAERSVEALARAARLNLTTASAHLQTLRQAGLVSARRDGTRIFYRLAGSDVADLYARARDVAAHRLPDAAAARDAYLGPDDAGEPVSREELLRRATAGEVTVVDVRPPDEYAAGHIRGAVNIPLDQLAERLGEVPDGVEVVAYCRGRFCVLAHDAVRLLSGRGRQARRLEDGMLEWRLADLPLAR
ncbi:MAG: metalloregulator ArsR/SmtB family transcription factor [Micromonosporaceae bacterium]|nr:metalloregulator ArsR/SmtB family transcription factor [Micromonosporaceae bacterium]